MDAQITRWINAPAGVNAIADQIMIAVTSYGVPLMILAAAAQWWARKPREHVRHVCVTAGLSFIAGLALNQLILLFVHRVRPYDAGVTHLIIERSGDWSFPSDHATASFAIVFAFLFQALPRRAAALLLAAAAVCYSRIFVGTHYTTDILGGMATALAAVVIVGSFCREGGRLDRMLVGIL